MKYETKANLTDEQIERLVELRVERALLDNPIDRIAFDNRREAGFPALPLGLLIMAIDDVRAPNEQFTREAREAEALAINMQHRAADLASEARAARDRFYIADLFYPDVFVAQIASELASSNARAQADIARHTRRAAIEAWQALDHVAPGALIAAGYKQVDDEDAGGRAYHWALYDRRALQIEQIPETTDARGELARELTGWVGPTYGGPGRRFLEAPYIARATSDEILVMQATGLDV